MQLTLEQQKEIEDSIWVVNTALKRQGLSKDEDLRQSAILYMCKCRLRFNPELNIKWTTYAYRNVYFYIKRSIKKQQQKQKMIVKNEFNAISNILPAQNLLEFVENNDDYLQKNLNSFEKNILELKKCGYNNKEIAEMLNCGLSKVIFVLRKIRREIKRVLEEHK